MRSYVSVMMVLTLAACGGSSTSSTSSGGGTHTGSGSETPVASGEDQGFDDTGATTATSPIDHGTQSPHALIGVHAPASPWASMSAEEREWYMVGVFLPIEGESFTHYDASRFTQFDIANELGEHPHIVRQLFAPRRDDAR